MTKQALRAAAEESAGLRELRALRETGPPDGLVPGSGSGRLNGRFATCAIAGITLLVFDWELEWEQEFADGTAHGEYWDYPVPTKQMWTGRCQAYMSAATPAAAANSSGWNTYMAANSVIYPFSKISGDGAVIAFTGYGQGTVSANAILWQGNAYASRGRYSAPRQGMFTQEISLRGQGAPTAGPLA